jgi:phosphatidate cytidylyltransferase
MTNSALLIGILLVIGLIAFATISVFALRKSKPQNETLKKVAVIVKSWWYIAVPFLAALYMGAIPLSILFLAASCFAMYELIKHAQFAGLRQPLIALISLVAVIQYVLLYFKMSGFFYVFIPLSIIWIFPILLIINPDTKELPKLGSLVLGALLFTYYLSHVPALPSLASHLWPQSETPYVALLLLVFLTEANDVLQFLSGKTFGKRKIVPILSPNKTEAGFIGGITLTTVLSALIAPSLLEISVTAAAILGAIIAITGILGDLLFSGIKRYYGVKDFSDMIPGHGGILDRLDSLILTAPIYFHALMQIKGNVL